MIKRLTLTLGAARLRALFLLLAGTGLASLILNAFEGDWVRPAQTVLALVFLIGAAIIIVGRLEREERQRWIAMLLPAFGAVILGLTVLPQFALPLFGAAVGWIVAGLFIFRSRAPMQYQKAVKHLRKNEYAEAVKTLDDLIKAERDNPNHYRFRAEVLRLWGKLDRARRDYRQMVELQPDSALAYNGLAEVLLQAGSYDEALEAAHKAYELAPDDWVAAYNLGMIEDRLDQSANVVTHLGESLARRVPEARHRALMRFYLARAHARLGDEAAVEREVVALRRERGGLKEWGTILNSDQAATLRAVIGKDVEAAEALAAGTLDRAALAGRG